MKQDTFTRLTSFLQSLERGKTHYILQSCRDEAIMVLVTVPGERWEVEFLTDGSVEIERFISDGEIYGEDILDKLFTKYTDWEGKGSEPYQNTELSVATGSEALDLTRYLMGSRVVPGSCKVHPKYRRNKTENRTAHMSLCPNAQDLVSDQVVTRHKDLVTDQVKSSTE